MSSYINISIFDLYKIGPGPSSSHTIGPMKIGLHFRNLIEKLPQEQLSRAKKVDVHLYGSLSATGKGHGTDRAVLGGLLGWTPESCDSDALTNLWSDPNEDYSLRFNNISIPFGSKNIIFDKIQHFFPYKNTMILRLYGENDQLLLDKEYYSCGGGFTKCKDEPGPKKGEPKYSYTTFAQLRSVLEREKISLIQLILENEQAISGKTKEEVFHELDHILFVMEEAVERGLKTEGVLPGPIKLRRKAPYLHHVAESSVLDVPDRFLIYLDAYTLAVSEENAAGNKVVTAPTSGAAGVVPGIIYLLKHYFSIDQKLLREGLLASAVIGFLAKHNASISGAEVGCQGEVGIATSMGAALLAHVNGCSLIELEIAAEIALEHELGMTCDPVGGYVQIPCIERNAVGACDAYNAFLLASSGDPTKQKLNFDQVVQVMLEVGRDMSTKYKETSKGGLATCFAFC